MLPRLDIHLNSSLWMQITKHRDWIKSKWFSLHFGEQHSTSLAIWIIMSNSYQSKWFIILKTVTVTVLGIELWQIKLAGRDTDSYVIVWNSL